MKAFSNKVVVVTGGSNGIGLSIAQKFSHHGAKLAILGRDQQKLRAAAAAAHIGWPSHGVYSSTKAAVSYLAKNCSADLISHGIRVNAVSPGFVDTAMFNEYSGPQK